MIIYNKHNSLNKVIKIGFDVLSIAPNTQIKFSRPKFIDEVKKRVEEDSDLVILNEDENKTFFSKIRSFFPR